MPSGVAERLVTIEKERKNFEVLSIIDTKTGEVLHRFERNPQALERARRAEDRRSRYLELRKIRSVTDVRSVEDLRMLYAGLFQGHGAVTGQGLDMLKMPACVLSPSAERLLVLLITRKLVAKNYAIVSNEEIQRLLNDNSKNYTRYISELEDGGYIRIRRLTKSTKLIAVHPAFGFCGGNVTNSTARQVSLDRWYKRGRKDLVSVKIDENDAREAA